MPSEFVQIAKCTIHFACIARWHTLYLLHRRFMNKTTFLGVAMEICSVASSHTLSRKLEEGRALVRAQAIATEDEGEKSWSSQPITV